MSTFIVETTILAPISQVWAALADIGNIADWNPGVHASHTTSEQAEGVGAKRHCKLGGKSYLDESVIRWEENRAITFQVDQTDMPFQKCHIHFTLDAVGEHKTTVSCSPDYTLKYGLAGKLLDRIAVKRTYRNGMRSLLDGLRDHVESA